MKVGIFLELCMMDNVTLMFCFMRSILKMEGFDGQLMTCGIFVCILNFKKKFQLFNITIVSLQIFNYFEKRKTLVLCHGSI